MPSLDTTVMLGRDSNFWFVLLHELGHVVRHRDSGLRDGFFDDDSVHSTERFESEADEFALGALIPDEIWKNSFVRFSKSRDQVVEFASRLGVGIPVVAGRVRNDRRGATLPSDEPRSAYGVPSCSGAVRRGSRAPFAQFRYTTESDYLVLKGLTTKKPNGYKVIREVAARLVKEPEYMGPAYSLGDAFVQELAQSRGTTGNASTWRWAWTDHHLMTVWRSLRALAGLPITVEGDTEPVEVQLKLV